MNSFDSLICCFYSPVYWGLSGLRWFSDLSWLAVSLGLKSCQHIWQLMLAVCWALSWSWQSGYLQVVSPTWLGFPHSMTAGFKNECPKSTRWKMDNLLWPSPKSHINSIRHVLVTSLNRFKRGIFSVVLWELCTVGNIIATMLENIVCQVSLHVILWKASSFFLAVTVCNCMDILNQFSSFGFAHCFVFLALNSAAVNNLIHSHFSHISSICSINF